MTKKKTLASAFFVFLLFSLVVGIFKVIPSLGSFFYWKEIAENPRLIEAGISHQNFLKNANSLKPYLKKDIEPLSISAKAAISFFVGDARRVNGHVHVFWPKISFI